MALVLAQSSDERMRRLASEAMLPELKQSSFAKLAERLGLNFHMISEEYRALKRSEGYIAAAKHLPELMEQAAVDAKSKWETCETCDGETTVPDAEMFEELKRRAKKAGDDPREVECPIKTCPRCKGEGKVYVLGDVDRLKMIFDTFGLTGKSGGVNVNLDLRKTDPHESMADLSASIAPILEGNQK